MTRRRVRRVCPACGRLRKVTYKARRFLDHERSILDRCPGSGQPAPDHPPEVSGTG